MAKISARGDSPRMEWRNEEGMRYVLTMKGRLLWRTSTGTYKVMATNVQRSIIDTDVWMHQRGYHRRPQLEHH